MVVDDAGVEGTGATVVAVGGREEAGAVDGGTVSVVGVDEKLVESVRRGPLRIESNGAAGGFAEGVFALRSL